MKIFFLLFIIGIVNAAITIQSHPNICKTITPKINMHCKDIYDKCVYIPNSSNLYISRTNMCHHGYTLKAGSSYNCCKKK